MISWPQLVITLTKSSLLSVGMVLSNPFHPHCKRQAKTAYGLCYNVKLFSELALRATNLIQYFPSYMLNPQSKIRLQSAKCGLNDEVDAEHIATTPPRNRIVA